MKHFVLAICLLSILTIGAGCSSKPQNTTTTTTPQIVIKKKPATADIKTQAENFCEAMGNESIVRFEKITQGSSSFCRLKDGSECEAVAYFTGKCVPGKKDKIATSTLPTKTSGLIACGADYEPICGADGLNYTNLCVAQAQGVKIAHKGVCVNKDIIEAQDNEQAVKITENKDSAQTTGAVIVEKLSPENWLPIVKDFVLSNPPSEPPAFIEKCAIAGKTYYFRSDGCSSCFTILYNTAGEPVCYPNNDMNGSCPASFDKAYRSKYCARVWQDPR